jgi:hypothetical protein
MQEVRDNTLKCGYCGKHYPREGAPESCEKCVGSEYLQAEELHLLRLLPVSAGFAPKRAELTEEERAILLPRYKEAQRYRNAELAAKQRARIEQEFNEATGRVKDEHDGMLWLLDNGLKIDNVIYYAHTRKFCFGWNKRIDSELLPELQELLQEFPWDYEIVGPDGLRIPKTSGER